MYSLNVQGVCDAQRRFIDVFIAMPGKAHDARVLQRSPFKTKYDNIYSRFTTNE